ncbi:MAG: hypothetical protein IJF34_03700, partial [Clostridia bacterium]|nr:hypothetical protein [Clostridia bacterium]
FGFVGMLVSVPTFAVIYTLTREGIGARLKAKGLSPLTQDYKSPGAIADVVPEEKPTNEETPNS